MISGCLPISYWIVAFWIILFWSVSWVWLEQQHSNLHQLFFYCYLFSVLKCIQIGIKRQWKLFFELKFFVWIHLVSYNLVVLLRHYTYIISFICDLLFFLPREKMVSELFCLKCQYFRNIFCQYSQHWIYSIASSVLDLRKLFFRILNKSLTSSKRNAFKSK